MRHDPLSRPILAVALLGLMVPTLAVCRFAVATTYYIDPNGSDGNGLSWATAKTTWAGALALPSDGNATYDFYVKAATYAPATSLVYSNANWQTINIYGCDANGTPTTDPNSGPTWAPQGTSYGIWMDPTAVARTFKIVGCQLTSAVTGAYGFFRWGSVPVTLIVEDCGITLGGGSSRLYSQTSSPASPTQTTTFRRCRIDGAGVASVAALVAPYANAGVTLDTCVFAGLANRGVYNPAAAATTVTVSGCSGPLSGILVNVGAHDTSVVLANNAITFDPNSSTATRIIASTDIAAPTRTLTMTGGSYLWDPNDPNAIYNAVVLAGWAGVTIDGTTIRGGITRTGCVGTTIVYVLPGYIGPVTIKNSTLTGAYGFYSVVADPNVLTPAGGSPLTFANNTITSGRGAITLDCWWNGISVLDSVITAQWDPNTSDEYIVSLGHCGRMPFGCDPNDPNDPAVDPNACWAATDYARNALVGGNTISGTGPIQGGIFTGTGTSAFIAGNDVQLPEAEYVSSETHYGARAILVYGDHSAVVGNVAVGRNGIYAPGAADLLVRNNTCRSWHPAGVTVIDESYAAFKMNMNNDAEVGAGRAFVEGNIFDGGNGWGAISLWDPNGDPNIYPASFGLYERRNLLHAGTDDPNGLIYAYGHNWTTLAAALDPNTGWPAHNTLFGSLCSLADVAGDPRFYSAVTGKFWLLADSPAIPGVQDTSGMWQTMGAWGFPLRDYFAISSGLSAAIQTQTVGAVP